MLKHFSASKRSTRGFSQEVQTPVCFDILQVRPLAAFTLPFSNLAALIVEAQNPGEEQEPPAGFPTPPGPFSQIRAKPLDILGPRHGLGDLGVPGAPWAWSEPPAGLGKVPPPQHPTAQHAPACSNKSPSVRFIYRRMFALLQKLIWP